MAINRFHTPDFSLRQLQYAVAIVETGGFGKAAQLCGVSQPSLSAQLAKLEDVLGVALFDREARGASLTAEGEHLLEAMRATLRAAAALETEATCLGDPYALPVTVAVIPTVAPYLLPHVVRRLKESEPHPLVHWRELQTADAEQALAEGEVDAVVIADPPVDPRMTSVDLGWDSFLAVLPASEEGPAELSVEWLADRDVLLLEDGHCLRDHVITLCRRPGTKESPYRATSLPTLVQMVAAGLGASVLPSVSAAVESRRADIALYPFPADSGIGRTLRMAWRPGFHRRVVLDDIASAFRQALSDCT